MNKDIVIIGGGASGFFAAIRAAELLKTTGSSAQVHLLESSPHFLSKVKISGGGRCNVTHNEFNPSVFCQNYPRGKRELRSPFTQFQAADTVEWFREKGVRLVAEADGRMFPSTNSSETVIECFMKNAMDLGVKLTPRSQVLGIKKHDAVFEIQVKNAKPIQAQKALIATGSAKGGYELAKILGHTITDLAPSLFSFKMKHPVLQDLSGTSFPNAKLVLKASEKKFTQEGPLLITHRGLSGPAILKLSAWAAREMKNAKYLAQLIVNWPGLSGVEQARETYEEIKTQNPKSQLKNISPSFFTNRFWLSFLKFLEIEEYKRWSELSKRDLNRLIENTVAMPMNIEGQNRFKEEFVECGGVKLSEVDFKTMQSKVCEGLYFSGEILDVDGITGGFNFQNAWTTGYIAGTSMASS